MIKEIKVILERKILTGGLKFTVVEMIPVDGGFPVEKPIQNVTVTILKDDQLVFKGWTDQNGVYQEIGLPLGLYNFKVFLDGFNDKEGMATVEV